MVLELPIPIAAYFTAEQADGEGVSKCFTENAVVKDEGHTYTGRRAIGKWKTEASEKYRYAVEPLVCERKGTKTVVTCRLTGSFPGSPVDLRFFFELADDKIAALEIAP